MCEYPTWRKKTCTVCLLIVPLFFPGGSVNPPIQHAKYEKAVLSHFKIVTKIVISQAWKKQAPAVFVR